MTTTTAAPVTVTHYIASNANAWGGPLLVDCGTEMRHTTDNASWDGAEVTCPACIASMRDYLPASRLAELGL